MNIEQIISKLSDFSLDIFGPTTEFYREIQTQIDYQRPLGHGATSTTYPLKEDPRIVVKLYRPCSAPQEYAINQYNCDEMRSQTQFLVLPHAEKKILLLANYLAEGVVGGLLNRGFLYTPHFIETYGVYFSRFTDTAYTIQERGRTDWEKVLESRNDAYILLFQVAHALNAGQRLVRFTDYDLHSGNLVFTQPKAQSYQYHLQGRTGYLNPRFITKIIDFGTARAENEEIVINGKNDQVPYPTRGVYNPFYDFAMLIGPRLLTHDSQINIRIRALLGLDNLAELLGLVFGLQIQGRSFDAITEIYQTFYNDSRPVELPRSPYATTETIVNYLASKIEGFSLRPQGDIWNTLPLPDQNDPRPSIVERSGEIDRGIRVDSIAQPGLNYHVVTIDPEQAIGYRFATRCCKLDPIDYLKDKFGVAMNGAFYDRMRTYLPIGPYRELIGDQSFESNLPIPSVYFPYYGYVLIEDGRINIQVNRLGLTNGDAFRTGPLLVWEGQPQFNSDLINQLVNIEGKEVAIFHCQKPGPFYEDARFIPQGRISVYNCDTIQPGELSHGANPNPRSMLITRQNGQVLFVIIEGRSDQSEGANFLQMIKIALELGAWRAINLDGGQSTNIAFRSPIDPNTISSLLRLPSYPVGNIITFTATDEETMDIERG